MPPSRIFSRISYFPSMRWSGMAADMGKPCDRSREPRSYQAGRLAGQTGPGLESTSGAAQGADGGAGGSSGRALAGRVLEDPHLLHGDEALGDHLVEDRQERLDPRARIDDLDQHRQVLGQPEDLRRMDDAVRAEAGDAAKDGGAREALPAQALQQRRGERPVMPTLALADEDPHQHAVAVEGSHAASFPAVQAPARGFPDHLPSSPAVRHARPVAPASSAAPS